MPGVEFVRFNDVDASAGKLSTMICAILLEAIQGEGGIRPVSQEFLETARELTRSTGALLIVDEIQSGLGRTGKWCAYQHFGVQPDIMTLAKPLAGGLPLGAMLCTRRGCARDAARPAWHNVRRRAAGLRGGNCCHRHHRSSEDMLAQFSDVGGYFKRAACTSWRRSIAPSWTAYAAWA